MHDNKVAFLIWIVLLFCHIFMPVAEDFCHFIESAGWGKPFFLLLYLRHSIKMWPRLNCISLNKYVHGLLF